MSTPVETLLRSPALFSTAAASTWTRKRRVDQVRPEGFVKACAQACANMGFPAAVLKNGDPDDEVWVLIAVPAFLANYMAETVRVRGVVRSAGILIPERVEIRDGDEWLTIM